MWRNRGQKIRYNFIFVCLIVLCIYTVVANAVSIYSDAIILIHFDDIIDLVRNSYPVVLQSDRAIFWVHMIALMAGGFGVIYSVVLIFSHNPRHWKRTCIMSGLLVLIVLGSTTWDLIFFPEQSRWKLRLLLHLPYPLFALYQRNICTKNS